MQTKYRRTVLSLVAMLFFAVLASSAEKLKIIPIQDDQVAYELIGEFINSGTSNTQYGYLSRVAGFDSAFNSAAPQDETTAIFTFVTNATTNEVVTHGPFRVINRTGTTTIYLNNGPSNFSDPSSFSQGTPVQISEFTQQSISNTLNNTFVTVHTNVITKVATFTLDGQAYRLGQIGRSFRTNYFGQINTSGPSPTGYFAGTSIGMSSNLLIAPWLP
jgi:hypothetical protein